MAIEPVTTSALVPAEAAAYPEPPPGVHLPGPSPWPFFAPIAMAVVLLGVIFSSVLIVGGLILGGHRRHRLVPRRRARVPLDRGASATPFHRRATRSGSWPGRLVPVFGAVIAISVLITLAPVGLSWLNSLTPARGHSDADRRAPAVPQISASTAVSFDTKLLIVPAGRPFELVFNNNQAGVPHNVDIADSAARNTLYFDGEMITGVATITYQVPALDPGDYYFLCRIHPNMNGTVRAILEAGPALTRTPDPTVPAGRHRPGSSRRRAAARIRPVAQPGPTLRRA